MNKKIVLLILGFVAFSQIATARPNCFDGCPPRLGPFYDYNYYWDPVSNTMITPRQDLVSGTWLATARVTVYPAEYLDCPSPPDSLKRATSCRGRC